MQRYRFQDSVQLGHFSVLLLFPNLETSVSKPGLPDQLCSHPSTPITCLGQIILLGKICSRDNYMYQVIKPKAIYYFGLEWKTKDWRRPDCHRSYKQIQTNTNIDRWCVVRRKKRLLFYQFTVLLNYLRNKVK